MRALLTLTALSLALAAAFAASASPIPLFNTYRAEDGLSNAGIALAVNAPERGTPVAVRSHA